MDITIRIITPRTYTTHGISRAIKTAAKQAAQRVEARRNRSDEAETRIELTDRHDDSVVAVVTWRE